MESASNMDSSSIPDIDPARASGVVLACDWLAGANRHSCCLGENELRFETQSDGRQCKRQPSRNMILCWSSIKQVLTLECINEPLRAPTHSKSCMILLGNECSAQNWRCKQTVPAPRSPSLLFWTCVSVGKTTLIGGILSSKWALYLTLIGTPLLALENSPKNCLLSLPRELV